MTSGDAARRCLGAVPPPPAGATLVELLVGTLIAAAALGLALRMGVNLRRASVGRVERTAELMEGLRVLEVVTADLERASVDPDTPRVFTSGHGIVLTVHPRGLSEASSEPAVVWYRFRQDEGVLERSEGMEMYRQVGHARIAEVAFSVGAVAVAPAEPGAPVEPGAQRAPAEPGVQRAQGDPRGPDDGGPIEAPEGGASRVGPVLVTCTVRMEPPSLHAGPRGSATSAPVELWTARALHPLEMPLEGSTWLEPR